MKTSKQVRRDAKQLFRACVVAGRLDDQRVRQAVAEVLRQKPRRYLGILSHFQRLVKLEIQRRTGRVESAVALDPALRGALTQRLDQVYPGGLAVQFAENPALIGGLRIKVGSDVYDNSIQARLASLAERF